MPVGAQIPTDEELVQAFGVGRHTVRAALDVPVADGVIARWRRRGSFVAARPPGAGTWMLTSLDDPVLSGLPAPPIVLDSIIGACEPHLAAALGLEEEGRTLRIRVLRGAVSGSYTYSVIPSDDSEIAMWSARH